MDFALRMLIIIFGSGFLLFLGAFLYDHYWFYFFPKSKEGRELEKKRVQIARQKALKKYYEEHPQENPDHRSR